VRSEAPGESLKPKVGNDSQDQWFAMFIQGVKVGHGWALESRLVDHGKTLLQIEEQVNFSVNRNGQRTDETIKSTGVETLDGEPLRFETEINSGQEPIVTKGTIRDGQIAFQTVTTGKTVRTSIPWPAGAGGFKATEHSLARQPMQPGERRKLSGLTLGFNQVAEIEMVATAYEPTMLLDHSEDLLRIDWTATLPKGDVIRSVWWTNRNGEVLKMQIDALHQVTYRTTREIAVAEAGAAKFDLLLSTAVGVDRPLDHAQSTRRVRYRVRLESEDPSRVFASGGTQRVTPIDAHTAEIVVQSIRPGRPAPDFAPGDSALPAGGGTPSDPSCERPPADEDRQPNNLVQSDAPRIAELAKEATGRRTDPWETAAALEQFVHQYVVVKNYLKAFSTAVEVAESREGACTQHAVLLAALARARGIPARVEIGLIYVEDHPGFAFHMWNEVWIGDRWIPLDATRGLGGIGAAYLKLADSSLQGEAAYTCFLPVSQVIGQAKIEILDAE
jgi:Transglutaminase-like superfamily